MKKIKDDKVKSIFANIRNKFITGLITILPLAITLWVVYKIFEIGDSFLGGLFTNKDGNKIPGLGLLLTLVIIVLVGYLINSIIGKKIKNKIESIMLSIPIISVIYKHIKEVIDSFSKKSSQNFKKVVLVYFPNDRSQSIGFITKENIMMLGENKSAVFIPTTPNPTNGFLIYLSSDNYQEIDLSIDVALKSIISLGSISPEVIWGKDN